MPNNLALPNNQPLFTYTPQIWQNIITGANSARDGTVNTGVWTQIASGANYGSRIEFISLRATGTTTIGVCRLFIDNSKAIPAYPNTGIRLWNEVLVSAVVPTASVAAFSSEISRTDGRATLILNSGVVLSATMEKSENMIVMAHGGDF